MMKSKALLSEKSKALEVDWQDADGQAKGNNPCVGISQHSPSLWSKGCVTISDGPDVEHTMSSHMGLYHACPIRASCTAMERSRQEYK